MHWPWRVRGSQLSFPEHEGLVACVSVPGGGTHAHGGLLPADPPSHEFCEGGGATLRPGFLTNGPGDSGFCPPGYASGPPQRGVV